MKWMQRCWLSIVRRPKKTIMLFLVAFAMGNLLAGSLSIIMTSDQIKEDMRNHLGATATIDGYINEEDSYIRYLKEEKTINQYVSIMEELSHDDNVVQGEYHLKNDGVARFGKDQMYFNFFGTNIIEPSEFKEGKVKLTENEHNRYFTKEELQEGKHVAIVDLDLRYLPRTFGEPIESGLTKIGNTITLSIPVYSAKDRTKIYYHDVEFKVIGNFKNKSPIIETRIYIPDNVLHKIVKEACEVAKSKGIEGMVTFNNDYNGFRLNGMEGLPEFDEKAESLLTTIPLDLKYESSNDTYKRNAGPIENLSTIAQVIFIVSIVATILILGLVIVSTIIERKKEMGIYASIGERKRNIFLQVLGEVILVATLATCCSSLSGIFLGNKLSDYMLEVQRYVQRDQAMGVIAELPIIYKPIEDGISGYTRDEMIDTYEIIPDAKYFITLFLVNEITVILSCGIPMMYLSRLKPKDIMI